MSDIKNYLPLVEEAAHALGYPFKESEQATADFTARVASRIFWGIGDKDFGLLRKNPGQNQHETLHTGIDVLMHRPTGYIVDIVYASGSQESKAVWNEDRRVKYGDEWFSVPPNLEGEVHADAHEDAPQNDPVEDVISELLSRIDTTVRLALDSKLNKFKEELKDEIRRGRCALRRY